MLKKQIDKKSSTSQKKKSDILLKVSREEKEEKLKIQEEIKEIIKSYSNKYSFNPDVALKKLFTNLKNDRLINILNYIFDTNYNKESIIKFGNTEQFKVLGTQSKKKVISDLMIEIEDIKTRKIDDVVIEFQSSKDQSMADRIFIYTLNKSKLANSVRKIAKGVIIYTTLDMPKKGFETIGLSIENFEINGQHYGINDIINVKYKYINLLTMEFNEYLDSPLEILKIIYLYKFRKDIKYISKEEFIQIVRNCDEYINTLDGEEQTILKDILMQLITDIENICISRNIYKEEIEMIEESTKTIGERITEYGIKLGREKGEKANKIKNAKALLGVISNELIAEKIGLTLKEVEELEKNNSN